MDKYDKILDDSAKRNMITWNLEEFKITHPRLYRTIIESMRKVYFNKK